jgi:DNA-binding beta-propeller fold protein YncE
VVLYAVKLDLQDLTSVQGLVGRYYTPTQPPPQAGEEQAEEQGSKGAEELVLERKEAQISFDWAADPPLPLPFNAEWDGVLYIPHYGAYTVGISAPGEAEVLIDEYAVLEAAEAQTIMLAKGNHALRVRAVGGPGRVELYWQPPGQSQQPIPDWALYANPPVTNNGLLGSYYPNPNWAPPVALSQIDPAIAMFFHVTPLGRPYTVEWQGMIAAPQSGDYAFATSSIDESQVYIDGELLVDNPGQNRYVEGRVNLAAGLHQIVIRYADHTDHSFIQLFWRPPGRGQEIVPASVLFPPQGNYPPIEEVTFAEVSPPAAPVEEVPPLPTPMPAPDMTAMQILPVRTLAVWGETGSGKGQFQEPVDVAVDEAGNVYVADLGNKRVQKFDADGKFLAVWDGGDEPFVEPVAVATGPGGEAWVLDSYTNWVHRFDRGGKWRGKLGGPESGFFHARGLAVDEEGVLYVANTGFSLVVKYNPRGEKIGEIGRQGSGPGEMFGPVGLAIDEEGLLYEADVDNRRLQVLERDGTYVRAWGIPESHTAEGNHVAVSGKWVYVTDLPRHRVLVYEKDGKLIGGWGREGGGEGEFRRPMGIGIGPDGSVYVADSQNNRIQKFAPWSE